MKLPIRLVVLLALFVSPLAAQQSPPAKPAEKKPRVFITDRDTWKESGWLVATNGNVAAHYDAGVVSEHTENVATFNKACPSVTITENKETADLALVWDRTDWNHTAWSGHQNNLALYDRNSDLVWSGATHSMTNAAKDACKAVLKAVAVGTK